MEIRREVVHRALESLYDNVQLANCELISSFPGIHKLPDVNERAEALRSLLLEALESLRPPRQLPFGSPESRPYDVLRLRYLERLRISQIEEDLALGRRQVFRDLREAETKLACVLTSWAQYYVQRASLRPMRDHLSEELLLLISNPSPVVLSTILEDSCALVMPLVKEGGKPTIELHCDPDVLVLADAAILKAVVVQVLSCAVQAALEPPVVISVDRAGNEVMVSCTFRGKLDPVLLRRLTDAQLISESQGMPCGVEQGVNEQCSVILRLMLSRPIKVLVIEDNPGTTELYRRYLSPFGWVVQGVANPLEACKVAQGLQPDIIVLDIMMPGLDG
jgi:CheY-like chemotaxis protein